MISKTKKILGGLLIAITLLISIGTPTQGQTSLKWSVGDSYILRTDRPYYGTSKNTTYTLAGTTTWKGRNVFNVTEENNSTYHYHDLTSFERLFTDRNNETVEYQTNHSVLQYSVGAVVINDTWITNSSRISAYVSHIYQVAISEGPYNASGIVFKCWKLEQKLDGTQGIFRNYDRKSGRLLFARDQVAQVINSTHYELQVTERFNTTSLIGQFNFSPVIRIPDRTVRRWFVDKQLGLTVFYNDLWTLETAGLTNASVNPGSFFQNLVFLHLNLSGRNSPASGLPVIVIGMVILLVVRRKVVAGK